MPGSITLVHSVKQNSQNWVGRGKGWNDSSWMWCVEEPALLSGLTHKWEQQGSRNQSYKNYHRVCSTQSVNSLHPVSGEVSEPREAHRSDGDSSHAAVPAGSGTRARYERLIKLTGVYPALPAPRTGMCDCHTALHTCAALTAPHWWSWWPMSVLHVVKLWWSALAKLIPKGQWQKWVKFRTIKALCSALATITGLCKPCLAEACVLQWLDVF